jgi:hypothetical protein
VDDAGFSGTVACGSVTCSTASFYCLQDMTGDGVCTAYPPQCGSSASCGCLLAGAGGCSCNDDGSGGLVVTCAQTPPHP